MRDPQNNDRHRTSLSSNHVVLLFGMVGLGLLSGCTLNGTGRARTPGFSGPIVITQGGTYSGKWESLDPGQPAVTVRTQDPVLIHNSTVRGSGTLIEATLGEAQLRVRNVEGYGVNPNDRTRYPGRFVTGYNVRSLVVEHSHTERTSGILVNGWKGDAALGQTITIRFNTARNIEGRYSDGQGGWQNAFDRVQFVQFDQVRNISGATIEWNRVENVPGESRVEDNVSLYKSSGTASSPIRVNNNLIVGAYGWPLGQSYTGGGIMLGDACEGAGYSEAVGNTVIETSNYGIAVAGGVHQRIVGNVILGRGLLANGTFADAEPDTGIYLRDYCRTPGQDPKTVMAADNVISWGPPQVKLANLRADLHNGAGTAQNNTLINEGRVLVDEATIRAAISDWERRASASRISVGLVRP